MTDADAFGYRDITSRIIKPIGIQCIEGKNAATLEPVVLVALRETVDQPDDDRATIVFTPEEADALAGLLVRAAALARQRDFH